MNRRIFVVGGSGFIGSHLVRRLITMGSSVTVYTRTASNRVCSDVQTKGIEVIEGDIRDHKLLEASLKEKFDLVINLASNPFIDLIEKSREQEEIIVGGTRNILECIKGNGVPFVYFSTCLVYGKPMLLPLSEDHPTNPVTSYAKNKLKCEELCKEYKHNNLPYIIIRPSPVYGPGRLYMRGSRSGVVGIFVNKLLNNEDIEIHGDGSLIRDFVYIDDVIDAVIHLIESKKYNEIFNISYGEPVTLRELAEICMEKIKPKSAKIVYKHSVHIDTDFFLSIDKLKRSGFSPKVSLNEGLDRYIEWCRKNQ